MASQWQKSTQNNISSSETPKELIPEVILSQSQAIIQKTQPKSVAIDSLVKLLMYQTGTATVSPTHKPRNLYEQMVWKDDGTNKRLWIWSPYNNGTWRYVAFS